MNTPFSNTLSVWQALFLREALDRLFGMRAAWVWLLVEPAMHVGFMAVIWGALRRGTMGGADMFMWIMLGMLSFFLFRRSAVQAMHALDSNRAFFAFRQVRPFDAALVRAVVEAFIMFFIFAFMLIAAAFMGHDILPADPLLVLTALALLWAFGLGYGLVASVGMRLVPETSHLLQIMMMPLYIISGVIMPIFNIPLPYRDWLLWNPLVHGLEVVRMGFFANYHTVTGISLSYLCLWALGSIALGMVLYHVNETRLVMQ